MDRVTSLLTMCCMLLGYSFKPRPKYLCTWYIMLSNEHWFTIKQMLALRLVQEFGPQRLLKLDVSGRSSFSPPWSRRGLKEALRAGCYNQLQNVETFPRKHNLSCFKSLLVTGPRDIILTSSPLTFKVVPPSFEHGLEFLATLIMGWRGDHKHKIMDRPFMPIYGTVSQVLLQLVLASLH